MAGESDRDLSLLLRRCATGDAEAEREVFELAYAHLKRLARAAFSRERRNVTLQASVLVNEAFLRMPRAGTIDWQNRQHFFAVAARAMRRIVIDHARERIAAKRRHHATTIDWNTEQVAVPTTDPESMLLIDRALDELAAVDARRASVVEMRFFSGMTHEEIAEVLGLDVRTVKRDWQVAKLWLFEQLSKST